MGYVDGDFDLETDLVDRRPVPPGENEKKFNTAARMNKVGQAVADLRTAVQALRGGGAADTNRPFGSISAWFDAPSANMTAGVEHNFVHPSMATHTILTVRGADNNGTTLTGLDATGIAAGTIRILYDTSTSEEDVGNIVLTHEDERSLPANRFRCPGHYDYTQPIYGCTMLIRGDDDRWHILSQNGYSKRVLAQSLQLYPHMQIGTSANPLQGTYNNWAPDGEATFGGMGIAGSDLQHRTHTYWRCFVHANGATITGIETGFSGVGGTIDASDFGAIKVIRNFGPGVLTIAHLGASDSPNQIHCPGGRDLKLAMNDTVWMIKAWYSGPEHPTNPQWRVISTSFSNEVFPSVTTTGRLTAKTVTVGPQITPSTLAAGLTSDYNPGSEAVIALTGTGPASYLDGLVPADALTGNEIRILRNKGSVPIILIDELSSASTTTNRFSLPKAGTGSAVTSNAPPYFLAPNSEVVVQYAPTVSRWILLSPTSMNGLFNTGSVIQPAALPGSGVHNYSPTDATSGLPGRFAYWWQIQGAVGTQLTGIKAAPTGLPPFQTGDRILLTNLGSGMTLIDFSGSSDVANRFRISGGNLVLSQYGSVELIYSGLWHVVTKA